jgi:hypothetical protein
MFRDETCRIVSKLLSSRLLEIKFYRLSTLKELQTFRSVIMHLSLEPNTPSALPIVLLELQDEGSMNTRNVDDALSEMQLSHARRLASATARL